MKPFALALAALPLLVGFAQDREEYPLRVDLEGIGEVSIAGVCQVNDASIRCWDSEGRDDTFLADVMRAHYMRNEIQLRYGVKNRFVVVRRPKQSFYGIDRPSLSGIGTTDGTGFSTNVEVPLTSVEWVSIRLLNEPSATEGEVKLTVNEPIGTPAVIALGAGASYSAGGASVTLGTPMVAPKSSMPMWGMMPNRPAWYVPFAQAGDRVSFNFTLLDASGKSPIWVDERGRITNKVPEARDGHMGWDPRGVAMTYHENQQVLQIFADPAQKLRLRVSATRQREVFLNGIPLDPKE